MSNPERTKQIMFHFNHVKWFNIHESIGFTDDDMPALLEAFNYYSNSLDEIHSYCNSLTATERKYASISITLSAYESRHRMRLLSDVMDKIKTSKVDEMVDRFIKDVN